MSEQARAYPPGQGKQYPWNLDTGTGHPVVPGRVGANFHGSIPPGSARVGAHPRRVVDSRPRGGWSGFGDRIPATWYRLAVIVSSGGGLIVFAYLVAERL